MMNVSPAPAAPSAGSVFRIPSKRRPTDGTDVQIAEVGWRVSKVGVWFVYDENGDGYPVEWNAQAGGWQLVDTMELLDWLLDPPDMPEEIKAALEVEPDPTAPPRRYMKPPKHEERPQVDRARTAAPTGHN